MNVATLIRRMLVTTATVAGLGIAPLVSADPVTIDGTGFYNGSQSFSVTGAIIDPVPTGAFTGFLNTTSPIVFFCYQVTELFSFNTTYTYDRSNITATTQGTLLSQLFTEAFAGVGSPNPIQNSAAFQLAVWEIEYETQPEVLAALTSGSFQVTNDHGNGATVTAANTLIQNLGSYQPLYQIFQLSNVGNPGHQDFVLGVQTTLRQVPEPSSLLLMAIALAGMGFALRRKSSNLA